METIQGPVSYPGPRRNFVAPPPPGTLLFDWDATLGRTMNGNKVVTWTDQIGGIVFSQATDALRADYVPGEFSLQFTEAGGTNYQTLIAPANIPKPYSLVVCVKKGADNTIFPAATVRIYSRTVTAHGLHKYEWNPTLIFQCGDAGGQNTGIDDDGNYHVAIRTFDANGNTAVYRDTIQTDYDAGATDYSGPTGDNIQIGGSGQDAGAGNFWIRRIQVYSGVLSSGQIAQLQIDLMPDLPEQPNITTLTLPDGTEGSAYSQQLAATGDGTITWTVLSGLLPDGMDLSTTGLLSSADILESGSFAFNIQASSQYGADVQGYILQVAASPPQGIPVFVGPDITDQAWDTDEVVSLDISAKFTGATNFELVKPWPLGLTISTGGVISGTAPSKDFLHPRALVKATNANGAAISNPFEVTVTDPTPPTNNLFHNSRMICSDPAQDPMGPWGMCMPGMVGATMTRTYDAATGGYELDITTGIGSNKWMSSAPHLRYGFKANVKYTFMADVWADPTNTMTQDLFSYDDGSGVFQRWSPLADAQVAPGVTKRMFICFSFTTNKSKTLNVPYVRTTAGVTNRIKIKNFQLVEGEYLTLGSLPAYEPTGPHSDGTYITIRDLGTVGRQVDPKEFMFDGLWWGTEDASYNINTALANENNLYYSPRPEAPRLEAGSFKIWQRWSNCEVSPGVFDWNQLNQYGQPNMRKLPDACSVFGIPFIMVVGVGPPTFYEGWRVPANPPFWAALVKDFTKLIPMVDEVLNHFVPKGLYGLEVNGEPSEGFWGESDTAPVTDAQWRTAASSFARIFKIVQDRIKVYNAAHGTTIRLFGPGDNHNFGTMARFSSPDYVEHGPGCLDATDGATGIGIDHLDGYSFHGYYSYTDTGMRIVKTIYQVQMWCKALGRPDMPVWCSEGLGRENPLTAFSNESFPVQVRYMLGCQAAMCAFDSQGMCHYAWDHNGAGFYGATAWYPPQGDYTNDWVNNYAQLETSWNALKTLLTTGGRKVYASRMRESDLVIELLVGTTRAGAVWYAMDETFTGA